MDNTTTNEQIVATTTTTTTRSRPNMKLKVLVRSHAMREETSPPRDPTSSNQNQSSASSANDNQSNDTTITTTTTTTSTPIVIVNETDYHSSIINNDQLTTTTTALPTSEQHVVDNDINEDTTNNTTITTTKCCHNNNNKFRRMINNNNNNNHILINSKKICDCNNDECIKCTNINNNMLMVINRTNMKNGKLKYQQFDGSSTSNSPCLSRDNSSEQYTDTSGIDLEQFIPETLNRNPKDRAFMLRIEQELINLAKDRFKTHFKFPPMSSYQRMLVHRCAAYFGMDHNIESSGKCVVVNKTKVTRIPEIEFKEHIKNDLLFNDDHNNILTTSTSTQSTSTGSTRRSILKRESNSMEEYMTSQPSTLNNNFKSIDHHLMNHSYDTKRSKSFEEREEEYEKARKRIFRNNTNNEKFCLLRQINIDGAMCDDDDVNNVEQQQNLIDYEWNDLWSNNGHHRLQSSRKPFCKLVKVQSEEVNIDTQRPYVAKSFSFGGYGRGDSMTNTKLLTKQDSGASSLSYRLSPSSSGYKSQSQMSESVTPSPTSTPHPIINDKDGYDTHIVWAVTNMERVPKGSIIIDPQTGQTLRNDDGSLYHYDPQNLPSNFVTTHKPPSTPTKKKRQQQHKQLINTATSPSLPFTPPPPQPPSSQPSMSVQSATGLPPLPLPQINRNYPTYYGTDGLISIPSHISGLYGGTPAGGIYGNGMTTTDGAANLSFIQHPYFVYATQPTTTTTNTSNGYTNGIHYELTPSSTTTDGVANVQSSYYMDGLWNGQQTQTTFYPNTIGTSPPQPQQQQRFMPPTYNCYYPSQQQQPPQVPLPPLPPQPQQIPTQTADLIPFYGNGTIPLIYPQHNPSPAAAAAIYGTNPAIYQQQHVPPPVHYLPPAPSTPNPILHDTNCYIQLAHNLAQMNLTPNHHNIKCGTPKNGRYYNGGKNGSSGGTISPATTIIAANNNNSNTNTTGYCGTKLHRTPSDTPPNATFQPMIYRQINNNRTGTPTTVRSSRSPTPAISEYEHRTTFAPPPPSIYHGMPYVIQPDTRFINGRNQSITYRPPHPPSQQYNSHTNRQMAYNENPLNRMHHNGNGGKTRRTK